MSLLHLTNACCGPLAVLEMNRAGIRMLSLQYTPRALQGLLPLTPWQAYPQHQQWSHWQVVGGAMPCECSEKVRKTGIY